MAEVQNDPDRVLHPLRRRAGRLVRARRLGRGARRDRRAPGRDPRAARRQRGRLVHGQPGRVLATRTRSGSRAFSTRSARRTPTRRRPRTSPTGSPRASSSTARRSSSRSPTSPAHRLPARRRRQPAGLARQRAERPAGQGPAARDHRSRRAGRGRRPAPLGDRARLRARRDRPRRRRLDAALDARGDLRRGARGPRRDRAPGDRHPRAAPAGRRASARGAPRRAAACRPRHVRELARDLAGAERAAVYGRTGSCLGRNGTLVAFLLDALNVVTGNLDREGGAMFGDPPIDFSRIADLAGLASYARVRSRVGDLPEVLGSLPASVMAKEMTTPGEGQIRAMFFSAGNPVLSVPNGPELEAAIEERRALGRDRPLRQRHRAALRLRAAGDDDVRARGLPAAVPGPVQHPVRPVDRAGRRAARRGAPGVGGHRGDLPPDRRRAVERLGDAAARQGRDPVHAEAARRPAAARRPEGRPVRAAPRWAERREAGAATRTGSCSPSTSRPTCCASRSATAPGGCASTRPRSSRTPSAWRSATATTPNSRCA